jgi:hypothetical protein
MARFLTYGPADQADDPERIAAQWAAERQQQ